MFQRAQITEVVHDPCPLRHSFRRRNSPRHHNPCGGSRFRTHAFLRTMLVLLTLILAMVLVENIAQRIFFPELFTWDQFERLEPLPVEVMPGFPVTWMNIAFATAVFGWLLYIAYACLRDHEASDGV